MSTYKKFDERENSGGLTPDYFMTDGIPVRAMPLNNDAGTSVQARTKLQYPNDMAARQGLLCSIADLCCATCFSKFNLLQNLVISIH